MERKTDWGIATLPLAPDSEVEGMGAISVANGDVRFLIHELIHGRGAFR